MGIKLGENIAVSGEILEEGAILRPFFSRVPPEFINILLHSHERSIATSLKYRWAADYKLIVGMKAARINIIKRCIVSCGVFPHSLYRTIQLFIKNALR